MKTAPRVHHGIAIINPYGQIWTNEIFASTEEALAHLRAFWPERADLSDYKLAGATLTIEVYSRSEPEPFIDIKPPAGK